MKRKIFLSVIVSLVASSQGYAVSVKNFREIREFYSAVFGINATDNTVANTYVAVKSRLPIHGEIGEFNTAALLGFTELAGAYCNAFVAKEASASTRVVHTNIDFNKGPKTIDANAVKAIAGLYADLLWERSVTDKETKEFVDAFTAMQTNAADNGTATRQIFRSLCALAATSLDSLIYK